MAGVNFSEVDDEGLIITVRGDRGLAGAVKASACAGGVGGVTEQNCRA